jgi:hypothetical protein
MSAEAPPTATELIDVPEDPGEFASWALEHGWGDGLPLVPPTPDRVERAVAATGLDPGTVIARLPPRFQDATVEKIAANAVMAGCRPEYLEVIIAAVLAGMEPKLNLYGVQATTHPCGFMVMVNGPIAKELGIHSGAGLFGPGFHANATIGRAMRLVLQNVGGAYPGSSDRSTMGSPGKFSFCFAENEEANPWEPYHVQLGFPADTSTVTVAASESPHNIEDHCSTEPLGLMTRITQSIASLGANNAYCRNSDYFVGLCPEHATLLSKSGWSKRDVQEYIYERARNPYGLWRSGGLVSIAPKPHWYEGADDDFLVPMSDGPDDIHVVVIGGPGLHSCWIPSFAVGRSVTRAIDAPA